MPDSPPPDAQLEAPQRVRSAGRSAQSALLRLHAAETIEQAYDAWAELRVEHAAFLVHCGEERRRLEEQGGFLLGAVRAAAEGGASAPTWEAADGADVLAKAGADPLAAFLTDAEEKLAARRQALETELARERAHYDEAFLQIRAAAKARIALVAQKVRPTLRLILRPLSGGKTILHAERPEPDEAVLLLHALSAGRAPTRYGYLFDDATDDLTREPPPLYPDEGVGPEGLRPDARGLREVCEREGDFLPVKGFIPVWVGDAFYRLLQRGPVLEVELQDGATFRNVLAREEGERLAGHLLRLKLQGVLEVELTAG